MNFIITAGGTSESIDSVRSITNNSTGALGVKISEAIHHCFSDADIYFICGARAFVPAFAGVKIIRITDTNDLQRTLTDLLTSGKADAVIHAMAVSDYRVHSVTTAEKLAASISADLFAAFASALPDEISLSGMIENVIINSPFPLQDGKISSDLQNPLILLEKTPKVIGLIKELQPDTILVGFKLLSNVTNEVLIDTAFSLLERNHCDLVFANDANGMKDGLHSGYLVDPFKNTIECHGKQNIAEVITAQVALLLQAKGEKP